MSDVTRILSAIGHGDPQAAGQLLPLVYDELRRVAAAYMRRERPDLVHAHMPISGFVARLAAQVGARFLDTSDPAVIPCGEAEFYDVQHATAPCLERLWKRLFPQGDGLQ